MNGLKVQRVLDIDVKFTVEDWGLMHHQMSGPIARDLNMTLQAGVNYGRSVNEVQNMMREKMYTEEFAMFGAADETAAKLLNDALAEIFKDE